MATENKKHIPALRFPEFQNDGEWKIVLLKDFTERIKSKVGNAQLRPISISAGIGFVDQKNKFGRDISGNQYSNYIVLKKGEFAYNKGNSIKYPQGCVYQLKEFEIVACPNVFVCFRIINNSVCPDFMSAYFASNYHGKQLQQYITSGVRSNGLLNISAETFLGIKTPLPSPAEQKKIADCLSSLDKYIDATKRQLELLKEHKKGLMQRLFPAKGKTTPKLRFSEFQNDGEWRRCTMNEIFSRITRKNTINNQNVLTISAQYGLISQYEYFNKNVAAADVSNYYLIDKHDFAYNKSRSLGYPYGAIKPLKMYDQGVVSPLYICFRIKDDVQCSNTFFEYYFESELIHKEIQNMAQEGARNHGLLNISTEDFFNKIQIYIPSFVEQKKIADTLLSVDKQISEYDKKIKALELHKKGLMQQLFPKL